MLKEITRGVVHRLGYEIGRREGAIRPFATHAPWQTDGEFQTALAQVRDNTMVDVYRLWEMWTLVEQVASVPGDIIEIGVWRGGSGALTAKRVAMLGLDAKVYLCDTFEGMVKTGEHDPLYRGGELSDTSADIVRALCDRMGLTTVEVLKGIFPDDTGDQVPSTQIRLCHIDVDVYNSARDVVAWVWDKMPVGALMVYDAYGFPSCAGITKHVDEQRAMGDRTVIHNLNGHAIVVKLR